MNHWKTLLSVFIFSLIIILVVILSTSNEESQLHVNGDLSSLIDFDVSNDDASTSARGVFFVMQKERTVEINISADIKVGETDEYGVEIFVPPEFGIERVLCSFNGDVSSKHVCVREWPEGGHFIFISQSRYYPDRIPIGGEGIVSIDLSLDKNVHLNEINMFSFSIAASNEVVKDVMIPISH